MRTIGMDHARQSRTAPRGFRVATYEKVLIALGVFLSVGSLVGPSIATMSGSDSESSPAGLGVLAPGLLFIVPALLGMGVRYALYRRRGAQSGSTTRSTRSSSPGGPSSSGGKG